MTMYRVLCEVTTAGRLSSLPATAIGSDKSGVVQAAKGPSCTISDPTRYPVVGQKEFTQEPFASMKALIEFGVEQREAGRPLYICMQ